MNQCDPQVSADKKGFPTSPRVTEGIAVPLSALPAARAGSAATGLQRDLNMWRHSWPRPSNRQSQLEGVAVAQLILAKQGGKQAKL